MTKMIDYYRLDPLELKIIFIHEDKTLQIIHKPTKKKAMVDLNKFKTYKDAGQACIFVLDKLVYG